MTAEEFVVWHEGQDRRYELVDGYPIEMMVGARHTHNVVTANIVMALGPQTRGKSCHTTSSDTAVRTAVDQVRYPDIVVNCVPNVTGTLIPDAPTLVAEIASPSTREFDAVEKVDEYRNVASLRHILLVEPEAVHVRAFVRDEAGSWTMHRHTDLDDVLDLAAIGAHLGLRDIYEGINAQPFSTVQPIAR